MIELVGLGNVPVQRSGVELRQQINALQVGVEAVGNGDIDEAIFACQRNGGFGSLHGQRKKPLALTASHDDGKNIAALGCHACALRHKDFFLANCCFLYNPTATARASCIRVLRESAPSPL
jgi:hypothetical protein